MEVDIEGELGLLEGLNSSSKPKDTSQDFQLVPLDTSIGLILAFSSCFFIGISVIYKKLALKDLQNQGETRAVDGGFGYLRSRKWWFGISLMGFGELTNFVAYIFAPAILVTPLGVFSIVCTATLSPYFLKERLNAIGKLGCLLVLVGCILVTLCGPKDREVATMEDLQEQLFNPGFLIYGSIVVGTSLVLMALVPRYGHKYVMFYITICSSFGSLSVMFCKGVGLALKQTFTGTNEFTNWITWVCLVSLIGCLLIETVYMQRALDIFNSSVFMSVNYVMFTTMVIVASSILYTELRELGWKNIILTILGFIVNIAALYLLHLDKETPTNTDSIARVNSPIQDPITPLMLKVNNNEGTSEKLKEVVVHSSPLSNIKLSPSLLRDDMKSKNLLAYMNRDNYEKSLYISKVNPQYISRDDSLNRRSSDYSDGSSANGRNSVCSRDDTVSDDKCVDRTQCRSEIPLIAKLQSSTTRLNSSSPTNFEGRHKGQETSKITLNDGPQVVDDGNSDTDEDTKLV